MPPPLPTLAFLSLALLGTAVFAAEPAVTISTGELRGLPLGDGGAVFRGIPYAAPPVGPWRWREPQPAMPWSGVRNAIKPGPPAAQPSQGWNADMAAASSEDCLYLDVWTPHLSPNARLPVMVWLHGGANIAGAGGFDRLYNGRPLIDHGVVLVVVEYRLGIFGFFAYPELTRESPHHASGNYGILDQIAALRWVHDNIAVFGGDPGNVTLFGQSAGSMDLVAVLASPLSRGLVHRAIAESGVPFLLASQPLDRLEQDGVALAKKWVGPDGGLAPMRALPTETLLKQSNGVQTAFAVDHWVFPEPVASAWRHGHAAPVPLIVGGMAIEFPRPGDRDELSRSIDQVFGSSAARVLALYGLDAKVAAGTDDPRYGNVNDQVGSDWFRCQGIVFGAWHAASGSPVWNYEFDRPIPPRAKTEHSGDLPYVFGHFDFKTGNLAGDYTAADRQLSETIQRYWTNFAKNGDPNGAGLPGWPSYDDRRQQYLEFTRTGDTAVREHQRKAYTDLYRDLLEAAAP